MATNNKPYPELGIKEIKKKLSKYPTSFKHEDFSDPELLDDVTIQPKYIEKKTIISIAISCFVLSILGIFGFLYYQQYKGTSVADAFSVHHTTPPDYKTYTNTVAGFSIRYPGTWTMVSGSNNQSYGGFYFSSANIDFKEEQSSGDAVVQVEPQVANGLTFESWLTKMETTYYAPNEIISKTALAINNLPTKHYIISPSYPPLAAAANVDMYVIRTSPTIYYKVILYTDSQKTHDQYAPIFALMVNSMAFSPNIN